MSENDFQVFRQYCREQTGVAGSQPARFALGLSVFGRLA